MKPLGTANNAGDRARWLAELSQALDEAANLLQRMGISAAETGSAIEIYLRIEEAQAMVRALRLRNLVASPGQSSPIWSEPSPWSN